MTDDGSLFLTLILVPDAFLRTFRQLLRSLLRVTFGKRYDTKLLRVLLRILLRVSKSRPLRVHFVTNSLLRVPFVLLRAPSSCFAPFFKVTFQPGET